MNATSSCPKNSDPCEELRKKIDDLINRESEDSDKKGLKQRFDEQINGLGPTDDTFRNNTPSLQFPNGSNTWSRHELQIQQRQRQLKKVLKDYKDKGCGDPPDGADAWVYEPSPTPEQWEAAHKDESASAISWKNVGAGAGIVLGAIALGVLTIALLPEELLAGGVVGLATLATE